MAEQRAAPGTAFLALLAALAAFDLLLLFIRLADVLSAGALTLFPAEGPVLYAIWRIREGFPLYEDPLRPPFTVTYYNPLHYETCAALFSLLRIPAAATPIAGRFVTVATAALGALAQFAASRRLTAAAGHGRRHQAVLALLAIVTWTGGVLPGFWAISIRPDMAATALGVCGVYAALRRFSGGRLSWMFAAGCAFAAAWGFKQSHVALLAATCVYTLLRRRSLRESAVLLLPLAASVAAAFAIGGALYRANPIAAPSLNPLIPSAAIFLYRTAIFGTALLWGCVVYAAAAAIRARTLTLAGIDVAYPLAAAAIALVSDGVLMMKVGSSLNQALELNVAASLVTAAVLTAMTRAPEAERRALTLAASLLLVPMIASNAARLRAERALPPIADERRALVARVSALPKPIFAEDDLLALPWIANSNQYPTVVLDAIFHDEADRRGLLRDGGLDGLIASGRFPTLVLSSASRLRPPAARAGYVLFATIPQARGQPLVILRR
jgi:hypothetical protein